MADGYPNSHEELKDDINRAWLISIGDHMLHNRDEIAQQLAKHTGVIVNFFLDYLHEREASSVIKLPDINQKLVAASSQKVIKSEKEAYGYENSTKSVRKNRFEQDSFDGNEFNDEGAFNNHEDEQIEFSSLSNELSKLIKKEVPDPTPSYVTKTDHILLLCGDYYDFSGFPSVSGVDYGGWSLTEIQNDLMQNADLTDNLSLIIQMNGNWTANSSISKILSEIERTCKVTHDKWPHLKIYVVGIVDNDSNSKLNDLNSALEQKCKQLKSYVTYGDLTGYLMKEFPYACDLTRSLTNSVFVDFVRGLVKT